VGRCSQACVSCRWPCVSCVSCAVIRPGGATG
jgi:hypothetical protein